MRIAIIVEAWEPIWGGGQVHAFELCKNLSENHDCQIDLYTMNLGKIDGKEYPKEELLNTNFKVIRAGRKRNFSFKDRLSWMIELSSEFRKNNKKNNYEIIHAHANLPGFPAKILGIRYNIPVIYTVHGSNFLDLGKNNFLYFIEKFLFTKIKYDIEISVTRKFLNYSNANKPVYIPNGVDVDKFEKAYMKYHNAKDANFFGLLFVGRLDKVKGVNFLLKAVASIKEKLLDKKVKLSLVGYGYDENNLKKLVSKLKIDEVVNFKGKIIGDKLLKEYAMADLFILPSLSEGFPITILEALASKLPLLTTDVGDNKFFVKDRVNGYLVPPKDSEALGKAILRAMDNKNLEEMGLAGFKMVKDSYTWKMIASQTFNEYIKLLKENA